MLRFFIEVDFLSRISGKFDLSLLNACWGVFFLKMFQNMMMKNSYIIKVRLVSFVIKQYIMNLRGKKRIGGFPDCWNPSDCGLCKDN